MQIIIDYEASWRNSFLDGSNNEAVPKKGRTFIASMTNLKQAENFKCREITLDTVMGILNRLIGDQRKLYQARTQPNYYFKDIEPLISFNDNIQIQSSEIVYIRNMTGSTDQNSFTGAIKTDDVMFSSNYSAEFWGVLALDFTELCDFIINNTPVKKAIALDPLSIIGKLEILNEKKAVANEGQVAEAKAILNSHYPKAEYLDNKGNAKPISFYCSTLYLQLKRLQNKGYNMDSAKTKAGCISGINNAKKPGFTTKDFMAKFTTGAKKKIWGNPYLRKSPIKGEGEVTSMLSKASGRLEIIIDVDRDKAKEINTLIENAGVSSFYLGKKGLAYIFNIDTRPERKN
ncbi:MAG: type I-Fv CRISPR-associated protein Cas5fv [Methylococcaceae bacterium]